MKASSELRKASGASAAMTGFGEASKNDIRRENMRFIQAAKVLREATGLVRGPQRVVPLIKKLVSDKIRVSCEQRHLYSYARAKHASGDVLRCLLRWILGAQQSNGGIAAYYSLLTGYSQSYPEVTGYLVPTLYDFAREADDDHALRAAERATQWLLSLQMPTGAFPGGLEGKQGPPSVFNTGQILHGLVRAHRETNCAEIGRAAFAAGNWLVEMQQRDGSWSGRGAYQDSPHSYYSMVSWALAELSERTEDDRCGRAAERNLDWVLSYFESSGWIEGINLRGHPSYLHFVAYALQGLLECAILRGRAAPIEKAAKSAWVLLRKFETAKFLPGAHERDFKNVHSFTCLTGNAQMSCVWLRLYEVTRDLRYLNAALKMNEMLKGLISLSGVQGIAGGVSGSHPVWGIYQPLRYPSWGCKFLADALLTEARLTRAFERSTFETAAFEVEPCAS